MSYKLPPPEVVEALDAPASPSRVLSPDRRWLLLGERALHPPIAQLARPFHRLAGVHVDPLHGGTRRTGHGQHTGLSLISVADGKAIPVETPASSMLGQPVWSYDGSRFLFTNVTDGIELWVGDTAGATRQLPGLALGDVITRQPFLWLRDSRRVLAFAVPADRPVEPPITGVPDGPELDEADSESVKLWTYSWPWRDLLKSADDDRLFEHYATTQLVIVDTESGEATPLGPPGLFTGAAESPDGHYLLVGQLHPPFSHRVVASNFASTTEVWDLNGNHVAQIAARPVVDNLPPRGVPVGPRGIGWQPGHDAMLVWLEALDGGDPRAQADHRDRLVRLAAPFTGQPTELGRTVQRCTGIDWLTRTDHALVTEHDWDRRWRTVRHLDLTNPGHDGGVVFDLSANDAYAHPGELVYETRADGERTVRQRGDFVYLAGRGASADGDRPFLDRRNLASGETDRLLESPDDAHEEFVAFLDRDDDSQVLIARQSPTEPSNLFAATLDGGDRRALTHVTDPHPHLTGVKKELIHYKRDDGVDLSGILYLPAGWQAGDGRLPLVIWAYPLEYSDAATGSQVRVSPRTFTRIEGDSVLWFLTQGYAVLYNASMPTLGDPETVYDTFVEQIVAAAQAAIDTLDERGIVDRSRVVMTGHSHGGLTTANLAAHCDLFAAAIARSGDYNRTLTPFGSQNELRTIWEAPESYYRISPYLQAHKIKTPLLLIHGADDPNPACYALQTELLFQAVRGNGGTVRKVVLPHEGHGYVARESVLHVVAEMLEWAERFAGPLASQR